MKNKTIFVILLCFLISLNLVVALPDSFDWRDNGGDWITPVKAQRFCGSCWAFAAVGVTEAQYNIAMNNFSYDLDLSEENLISNCSNAGSCAEGWHHLALEYIQDTGIVNESCFPYVDSYCGGTGCAYGTSDAKCSDNECTSQEAKYKIDNYILIDNDKEEIKDWLVNHGPVAVDMKTKGWTLNGGVYTCSTDYPIDHSVVLIGYNETGDYWIIKNSWGPTWGDGGYAKVGFNECGIQSEVYGVNLSVCSCSGWSPGTCGAGTCSSFQREHTRSCSPDACDIESVCEYDESCITGTIITVCASGCDYTTIQSALDNSGDRDMIKIMDNRTYSNEGLDWSNAGDWVILNCQGAVISDSGYAMYIEGKDHEVVMNCIINASSGIRIDSPDGYSFEFLNNVFDIQEKALYFLPDSGGSNYIEDNIFMNGDEEVVYFQGNSSVHAPGSNVVRRNLFLNNYWALHPKYSVYNDISDNIFQNNARGIYMRAGGENFPNDIYENNFSGNTEGIYIYSQKGIQINNNNFCPSSSSYDIYTNEMSLNGGTGNVCELTSGWHDDGVSGCTYFCDSGAEVNLLSPPNEYTYESEDVELVCYAEDNLQLANVTLYHNISGSWEANQTKSISGTSNITIFNLYGLQNGTGFIWNCLAYDNVSRGGFADMNWSVNLNIDSFSPEVNVISPLNQVYNVSTINFNLSLNEDGFCNYSLDNAINITMDTEDYINYYAVNSSMMNGTHIARFYCEDIYGNMNSTEYVVFDVNIIPPDNSPTTTLTSPPDSSVDGDGSVTFSCSATDDFNLKNITLYGNWNGVWHANETKSLTGISNSTTFTKNLANGVYQWNCLSRDNVSQMDFANSNWTINVSVIATPANDTYKFYHKNSANENVAWFGSEGNIVLKGRCYSGGNCNNPGSNSIIFGNSTDNYVAFINSTGDLCLEKGDCSDESLNCNSPVGSSFIVKDSSNVNVIYIDRNGDLCLTGSLYENSNP